MEMEMETEKGGEPEKRREEKRREDGDSLLFEFAAGECARQGVFWEWEWE